VKSLTTPAEESRDLSTQESVLLNEASRNQTITIASVNGTVPDQANSLTQYQSSGIEANKLAVKRRKEASITTKSKRKRLNNRRTQWFGFNEALLDRCISLEKTKCDNLRLARSERSY